MKKCLTIILLAVFTVSFGQTSTDFKRYYKSGKIRAESRFDKACNCSKVTEYFESGKILSSKTYLHTGAISTHLNGEDIRYFENGTIQIYYLWKKGAPSGRAYSNFSNGKVSYEKFFANGFKTGTWKFYNQDGSLREEEIFAAEKIPWNSDDDYATNKFYFNSKLVYAVELVAGKETNLKVIDQTSYDKFVVSNSPTGKKLFNQNCSMCHSPNADIVGPMMKGVTSRHTNEWLTKMIKNGDALRKSGDKDAIELYKKWGMEHPNFEQLSDEEVDAIIGYLKALK